ncbi:cysteine desulfurase family protein [Faecalibacter sp. LW9]|uniref:cysteine desulfurase family protein n=1 Tax=Faecalibacter sp. LW9 TaxID=3103144 RepID=UPI002AFE169E|nr:cysteine desulfurase family protein [Faecalibacter sp. LW9]
MIYLDNASTTKINEEVLNAMMPYFDQLFYNASSNHKEAQHLKNKIEEARKQCSNLIHADAEEIIFTSGATESINYALKGYFEENFEKGNHIITCKTEHKAVLKTCEYLETKGIDVTYLDVDSKGRIDLGELQNAITDDTAMIAIMFANNETGVLQDIEAIGSIAKNNNVKFFCDATQAIGKIPIDVKQLHIDLLCMSAHKINGPKGIGFLYVKKGIRLTPLLHGGAQENDNRGGTYNTPLIVGLGKAIEISQRYLIQKNMHYLNLYRHLFEWINSKSNIRIIGDESNRLYNIVNIKIHNFDASIFVESSKEFAVSNGSACTSRIIEGSHVLKAMGLSDQECNQCLRISFDENTQIEHIIQFLKNIS